MNPSDEEKVAKDLELIDRLLAKLPKLDSGVVKPVEPEKLEQIRKRNKKMRKTSMQKAFKAEHEDEDNYKLMELLLSSYKSEKRASRVMDKHMELIDTMNKS